jgi:hypothetical protein
MSRAARLASALAQPLPWTVLGLGLRVMPSDAPRSTLGWLDWPLYVGVIGGFAAQGLGWRGARLTPLAAALGFLALSLAFGTMYELSLTVDGTGWGGVHPDTRTSFVLAFGDYAMLALACLLAIRWLRLSAAQLYWLAFGISMTEGAVFTGVLWQVPLPAMPIYVAYYALAYATFLVLPALLVNPRRLWRDDRPARLNPLVLLALGFAIAFAVRVIWGLVYGPIVTDLFSLLPPVA